MNDDNHPSMQRLFTATGMQASELARALDTSPQNITNWSARGISKNGALLASRIFGLDANYLLKGTPRGTEPTQETGEQKNDDAPPALVLIPQQRHVATLDTAHLPTATHRRVIRYDVRLSAGSGNAEWVVREKDDDPLYFRNGWFKARHLDENNLRAMYVSGDSMEPYLYDKDTVIIDITETDISDGDVYAILFKGKFYVKELRNFEDGVKIISRNPKYEMMKATPENCKEATDFQVLGHVVWRGG